MLRVRDIDDKTPPTRVVREIRGEQIPFWIRPWNEQIAENLRKQFVRGFEWVTNQNGRRVKSEIIDNDAFYDAMVDYVVHGFEEIGDEQGRLWPNDLEHKKKVIALAVEVGAQPVWEWVLEEAKSLSFVRAKEQAAQEKNSPAP